MNDINQNRVLQTAALAKARAAKAAKRLRQAAEDAARPPREPDQAPSPEAGVAHAPLRDPLRQPLRAGRAEVIGRNGEKLSRTRTSVGDNFDIPKAMIPKGWSYQWNVISVIGNTDIVSDQSHGMQQNGWRAVPAERYAGTLVPASAKGSIMRGGLRLEERPEALSIEAHQEDIRAAKQLISDRNESLKLSGVSKNMGQGFEMNSSAYRGTGGSVRMTIDPALDVPAPSHTMAKGDE